MKNVAAGLRALLRYIGISSSHCITAKIDELRRDTYLQLENHFCNIPGIPHAGLDVRTGVVNICYYPDLVTRDEVLSAMDEFAQSFGYKFSSVSADVDRE